MKEIKDKKELMKLCSFIVMGDGGLYKTSKDVKNYRFIMNMKSENLDYIEYCKSILENITNCRLNKRKDYNTDNCNRKEQLRLESKTHPFFTILHDRIYTEKYKGLDPHAFKLFDWECLAILFMCDGCGCYKNGYKDYSLNLKRLSYGDQIFLKKQLKEKLDLEWNINKQNQYYYLRLRKKDYSKFEEGIKPYILTSFSYKILNEVPLNAKGDEIV